MISHHNIPAYRRQRTWRGRLPLSAGLARRECGHERHLAGVYGRVGDHLVLIIRKPS